MDHGCDDAPRWLADHERFLLSAPGPDGGQPTAYRLPAKTMPARGAK